METSPKELPYLDKSDPWSSHSLIVTWLARMPKRSKVLDVGCASGIIGRRCTGMDLHLTGLEPEPSWADIARPYYRELVVSTVEESPATPLSDQDAVIFGDVLEHLPDPLAVLNRVIALQHLNTVYMISVPNVANLFIRLNLLFGRFEYSDRGILDRTHLRFFTRSTLLELISDAGLKPVDIQVTPVPLNLVHPGFETRPAGRAVFNLFARLTRLMPTLLGYQFVIKARKL